MIPIDPEVQQRLEEEWEANREERKRRGRAKMARDATGERNMLGDVRDSYRIYAKRKSRTEEAKRKAKAEAEAKRAEAERQAEEQRMEKERRELLQLKKEAEAQIRAVKAEQEKLRKMKNQSKRSSSQSSSPNSPSVSDQAIRVMNFWLAANIFDLLLFVLWSETNW